MTWAGWIMLISIIIFIFLAAWGAKFPRSRHDWKKDRSETLSILMSASVFLLLFMLFWYVVSVISWPDPMTMIVWGSILTFFGIILAAIFLPKGLQFKMPKKKLTAGTDSDDE